MAPTLPGVRVGPLDPDATADFGSVAGGVSARQLVRRHAALHPPALIRVLSLAEDEVRTKALDMVEVRRAIDLEDDDAAIVGAAVRGTNGEQQYLAYTVRVGSGRTYKSWVEYSADDFPHSVDRGDEATHIADLKEAGLFSGEAAGSAETVALKRQLSDARRQVEELSAAPPSDIDAELADLREQLASLQAQLSGGGENPAADGEAPGDGDPPAADPPAATDEPVPGYSTLKADQARDLVKATDDPAVVQAIIDYEKSIGGPNRSTVISLAEERITVLAQTGDGSDGGDGA